MSQKSLDFVIKNFKGFDLFNLRRQAGFNQHQAFGIKLDSASQIPSTQDGYIFDPSGIAGGVAGTEQERFSRWLESAMGFPFKPELLDAVLEYGSRELNPVLDCWGATDNIFSLPFILKDDNSFSQAIGFFQRGPIHEPYECFMKRAKPLALKIAAHHAFKQDVLPFRCLPSDLFRLIDEQFANKE